VVWAPAVRVEWPRERSRRVPVRTGKALAAEERSRETKSFIRRVRSITRREPHQIWATDASYFRVVRWSYYYLVTVLDERSSEVLKLVAAATPLAALTNIYLSIERVRGSMAPLVAVSAVMLGTTGVLVPRLGIIGAGYPLVAGYGTGALLSLPLIYRMVVRGDSFADT